MALSLRKENRIGTLLGLALGHSSGYSSGFNDGMEAVLEELYKYLDPATIRKIKHDIEHDDDY